MGQDAAEGRGGALKGARGGGDERVLPGGGEVFAGVHTRVYRVSCTPQSRALKAAGDGGKTCRRRGRASRVPGPWRVSVCRQQRLEGLLVETGVPQPFPGVLEPKRALSGKKMMPRTAAPVASAHIPPTTFSAQRPSSGRKCSLALSSPGHGDPAPESRLAASRGWGGTLLPSGYSGFPVERLLCDPEIHTHPRTCALIWKSSLCRCDSRVLR